MSEGPASPPGGSAELRVSVSAWSDGDVSWGMRDVTAQLAEIVSPDAVNEFISVPVEWLGRWEYRHEVAARRAAAELHGVLQRMAHVSVQREDADFLFAPHLAAVQRAVDECWEERRGTGRVAFGRD